jgi:hypothetical protein
MKPSATCFWLTGIWGEDKKSPDCKSGRLHLLAHIHRMQSGLKEVKPERFCGLIGRCHKVSQAYKEKKLSNSSLPVKVFL